MLLPLQGPVSAQQATEVDRLPQLVVDAPVELTAVAIQVRELRAALTLPMQMTGLTDPGPAIHIVLAPESSPLAAAAPAWVSGYAQSATSDVVLFPGRLGAYPNLSLQALLQHEVAHVLIHRAAGGHEVPRWFNEGLAMAASREADLGDRARVALAVMSHTSLPLSRVDQEFANRNANPTSAYALARDFVGDLLRRYGPDVGARILSGVARGESFSIAFRVATGESLDEVEQAYWRRRSWWDRWIPLLSSSALLWAAITFLAILAFRRRVVIDEEIRDSWHQPEIAVSLDDLEETEPDVEHLEAPASEEEEIDVVN